MHADRLVRKRKAQHATLQAREPALINLPIPIPSNIPLLSPIINPLIAGIPASEFPLPIQSWPPLLSFPPLPGHTTKTTVQPGTPPATPPPAQPTATNAPVPTAAPQQPPTGVSPPNNSPPSGNDGGGSQSSPSGGSGNGGGSGEGSAGQGSGGGSPSGGGGSGGSGGDGQGTGGPSSSNSGSSAVVNGTVIILPSGIVTSLGASITWSTDAGGRTFANGLPIPTQNAAVNVGSNPPTGTGIGSDNVAPGSSPSVTYAGHGSHATGTSGQAGSGTSPGGNGSGGGGDPSEDDPTTPGPGGTAGASHKPFPQAAIIALAVIGAIAFLAVIVICCRRSARARRIARRKLWFNGEKHASMYGAVSSSGYFRENDVRSSYATSYEQHTDPFRLSGPPVPLGSDWPLYRSEMSQAANVPQVTIPTPLIVNCKPPSPTVRSESRPNSMGSDISNPFDDTAQPGQVLLVPERSLISPDIPGTPLSVRPFSPSERWSFPMPPSSQRASSQFPPRTSSASPDTFNTVYTSDYQTANDLENPFADFDGSDAGHTSETYITADSDAAAHFSHIEVVYRPFDPERSDEICVDQGDRVRVLKRFEDGWAFAENYTSGQRGLFPIDCLRQPGQELPAFLAAKRLSSYTSASSARLSVMKDNTVV